MDTYPNYAMWGTIQHCFFLTAMHRYGSSFEQNMRQVRLAPPSVYFQFRKTKQLGGRFH